MVEFGLLVSLAHSCSWCDMNLFCCCIDVVVGVRCWTTRSSRSQLVMALQFVVFLFLFLVLFFVFGFVFSFVAQLSVCDLSTTHSSHAQLLMVLYDIVLHYFVVLVACDLGPLTSLACCWSI